MHIWCLSGKNWKKYHQSNFRTLQVTFELYKYAHQVINVFHEANRLLPCMYSQNVQAWSHNVWVIVSVEIAGQNEKMKIEILVVNTYDKHLYWASNTGGEIALQIGV